jgi:Fe-S-cluster containining protein
MPCDPLPPRQIFNCQQCGDCCKGFGGTYVSPEDIDSIAAFIHAEPESFLKKYCQLSGKKPVLSQAENGYCIFWKDRICTIHPVKPRMCKAWPFIPNVLKDPENWYVMAGLCPGIRADVTPSEIVDCVRTQINQNCAGGQTFSGSFQSPIICPI